MLAFCLMAIYLVGTGVVTAAAAAACSRLKSAFRISHYRKLHEVERACAAPWVLVLAFRTAIPFPGGKVRIVNFFDAASETSSTAMVVWRRPPTEGVNPLERVDESGKNVREIMFTECY